MEEIHFNFLIYRSEKSIKELNVIDLDGIFYLNTLGLALGYEIITRRINIY
jgi:hypothetical protein